MRRWIILTVLLLATVSTTTGCSPDSTDRMLVKSSDCFVCHIDDYDSATNPSHVGMYPITCGECHDTDAWRPARNGLHPEHAFPIADGHHTAILCFDCHDPDRGSSTNGINTDCVGCHLSVHLLDDMNEHHRDRAVPGYPTNPTEPNFCLSCHPNGSSDAGTHPERNFPIETGHHTEIACFDCHDTALGSSADGSNTDCIHCHEGAHPREETDPEHDDVTGYPEGDAPVNFCLSCHPDGSADASRHPEREFPIETGHHVDISCSSCHHTDLGSSADGANTDCIHCHDGAHPREETDPEHDDVTGYPEGDAPVNFCLSCHPDGSADASRHPEARFPIDTGNHRDVACDDCHHTDLGSSADGANTDCIHCHDGAHPRAETDPDHDGVTGYPEGDAQVNFCLSCHPDGSADASRHPEARFPIDTGNHRDVACDDCHHTDLGSSAGGANTDCIHCHDGEHPREETDPDHAGIDGYPEGDAPVNFCLTCHPSGNAEALPHPETRFPIVASHHSDAACSDCHHDTLGSNIGGANTDCIHCHDGAHPREETDPYHSVLSDYPDGDAPVNFCLSCHPNGFAEERPHPEHIFEIGWGPHRHWACNECHDTSLGLNSRENTDCIGCHTGRHANEENRGDHQEGDTRTEFLDLQATGSHHFCLECHPDGRTD